MTRRPAFLALAAFLVAAGPAPAQEAERTPAEVLASLFGERAPACYVRSYDARHLAANPNQTVTFIALARGYRELAIEESFRRNTGGQPIDWRENALRVAFRDTGRQRWESRASCNTENGRIECSANDCDSGIFEIKAEPGGGILITILTGDSSPVALGSGCGGGEKGRTLGDNRDDRVFRLAPADPAQCR